MIRTTDRFAFICIMHAAIFCCCGVLFAYQTSQDTINTLNDYKMSQINQRLERLETGALWLAGALIANLGAHAFQIRGEAQRRRLEQPE